MPAAGQQPVRAMMVSDGLSNTLLFGERNPGDASMDSYQNAPFAQPPDPPILAMTAYCGWGSPTGPSAIVSATFSASATVNFGYPTTYVPPLDGVEVPLNWNDLKDNWKARLGALGSRHPGLANVAFGDGSVKFLRNDISLEMLKALCTRAGGESLGEY
jgi:prepilin-type processing-associated H-X9-DG protein